MRRLLLLLVMLFVSGSLFLIFPEAAVAQGWEGSGGIIVGDLKCIQDSECGTGQYCFNFRCDSCPGSPGVCKQWASGGGCSFVNAYEGVQDGCSSGWWCSSGTCISCQPTSYDCAGL